MHSLTYAVSAIVRLERRSYRIIPLLKPTFEPHRSSGSTSNGPSRTFPGIRRIFRRRSKAATTMPAATGPAYKHDPPGRSATMASSPTKTFLSGIKLLHNPARAAVEYIHFHSKFQ
ncbi:hypothetical protein QBC46DRAFT_68623 [Diplogelasinospora grovesii]|uniref:Uncharacterized protein n=1 Tax=Diplogelasinospora grovesii TaxID=303347 RepID=A0AAN6MXE1_9PEZI|nr:hypothetical protein QBC46DRAFT_68623 [Diplogelasinospora grovesii]